MLDSLQETTGIPTEPSFPSLTACLNHKRLQCMQVSAMRKETIGNGCVQSGTVQMGRMFLEGVLCHVKYPLSSRLFACTSCKSLWYNSIVAVKRPLVSTRFKASTAI